MIHPVGKPHLFGFFFNSFRYGELFFLYAAEFLAGIGTGIFYHRLVVPGKISC
jgi:hypothetical protein